MRAPRTHVLVDLDGTISDSSPGIGRSLRYAFDTCGYPPLSDDAIRALIGPPFEMTFPALGIDGADIERVIAAYRERYEDVGLFENTVYEGVGEMLDELAGRYTLVLATAKPQATAVRIIDHFGFTGLFAHQVGASAAIGSPRRTKAEVIGHALASLNIQQAEHVVMIGDRGHDVEGAAAHGIECIGVSWGFGSVAELHEAGATVVVDSPDDVVAAVAGSYRAGST